MKLKSNYTVIGLMSGTSLDGLDIASCNFVWKDGRWKYKCSAAETIKYPQNLLERIKLAPQISGEALSMLDIELGQYFGMEVKNFIKRYDLTIDFVASHGHTVFHQPENHMTLQIGNGMSMLKAAGVPVINDFRLKDVMLGGQGAPLVPIGDKLLFSDFDYCLNLGGIANVSTTIENQRIAFDIAPCNMIFNRLSNQLGFEYDDNGDLAKSGNLKTGLLERLNTWSYYKLSYPKSLGYEQVSEVLFPMVDDTIYDRKDALKTYTQHLAEQISGVLKTNGQDKRVLITGGGAYNKFLLDQLNKHVDDKLKLIVPEKQLVDFKEAIIFGFLGVLRVRKETNCLASVTGASTDNCGGVIFE